MPRSESAQASTVPSFETVPMLAADPDFINAGNLARTLVMTIKKAEAELEQLRPFLGARAAVAGCKSINYLGLVITNTNSGSSPGPIEMGKLVANLVATCGAEWMRIVAIAATGVDAAKLLELGVGAHVISASRGPDKVTSASVRFELRKEA